MLLNSPGDGYGQHGSFLFLDAFVERHRACLSTLAGEFN
jgi:hypothetical protein